MTHFYFLIFSLVLAASGRILETPLNGENKVHLGTEPKESYPALVSIQKLGDVGYFHACGGSLITNQHILTAAHCYEDGLVNYRVILGSRNKKEPFDAGSKIIQISDSSWTLHSNYSDENFYNHDIAVIHLPEKVIPKASMSPTKLAAQLYTNDVRAVGWGRMNCQGGQPERYLFARGHVEHDSSCRKYYPGLHESNFCASFTNAKGERSGTDVGYSGGPIFAKLPDGSDVQIGAVSFGDTNDAGTSSECVNVNFPVLFNKIPAEQEFIREIVPTIKFY